MFTARAGLYAAFPFFRQRVIELRRQGLSVYEISTRLAAEHIGLNRTGVGQILAEEGFGRLLRSPADEASTSPATTGRDTRLSRTTVIDFAAFPTRADTRLAGLLLTIPDLVALDAWPGRPATPARRWCPPCRGCLPCWPSS